MKQAIMSDYFAKSKMTIGGKGRQMKFGGYPQKKNSLIVRLRELTGLTPVYNGAPEFSYDIGVYKVCKDGSLEVSFKNYDRTVISALIDEGFLFETDTVSRSSPALPDGVISETGNEKNTEARNEDAVRIRKSTFTDWNLEMQKKPIVVKDGRMRLRTMINLTDMVYARGDLMSRIVAKPKAFWVSERVIADLLYARPQSYKELMDILIKADGTELVKGIQFSPNAVIFNGFPETDDLVIRKAYETLAEAMYNYSARIKWISSKRQILENEKYVCRNWLNRIGLSGTENKTFRAVLMNNLSGNGSYRTQLQASASKIRRQANDKKTEDNPFQRTGSEEEIKGAVGMAKQMKMTDAQIKDQLAELFSLTAEEADAYVK